MSPVVLSRRRSSPTCLSRIATGMPRRVLDRGEHLALGQWLKPGLHELTEHRSESLQIGRPGQTAERSLRTPRRYWQRRRGLIWRCAA